MRFTYFLINTMVIVATLHASGNALATTKESTHAIISDVASQNIINSVDAAHVQGVRLLREVEDDGIEELEDEERMFKRLGESLKAIGKHIPFTRSWREMRKKATAAKDVRSAANRAAANIGRGRQDARDVKKARGAA